MQWKRLLPRSSLDRFSFFFSLFGMTAMFILELFVVLPWVVSEQENYSPFLWFFHVSMACLLYFNSLLSFWKTIATDPSVRNILLPSILKPDWRYCSWCEGNAPPRSFHCHTCKVCILRRDHHCIFTGNCIGYNNHRYFMLMLLYVWVASVYSNIMNFNYVWYTVGDFSVLSVIKLIFPFFSWMIRQIDFVTMVTTALLLLSIAVMVTITVLMLYHLQNIYYGQITYERSHKIFTYNIGWKNNMKAVFGKNWKYAWICPGIPSALPHDGQNFPIAGQYEVPKDL